MEKLVTYGIASYNHNNYIKKAIDSVLDQTYQNIELIVIDDCSTDDSDLFLKSYSKEKGFKYIRNSKNIGAARTISKLLHMANGEYICWLASDDWIDPRKVELQMKYLEDSQWSVDALYGPVIQVNESNHAEHLLSEREESAIMKADEVLNIIYKTGKGLGLIQSGIFKTQVARKIDFLEGYKSDDFLFLVRLLQSGYTVGYFAPPLTYYRLHEHNSHKDPDYCLYELEIPVVRDFIPKKYQKKLLAKSWLTASIKWFHKRKYLKSIIYLIRSLWLAFSFNSLYQYLLEVIGMRFVNLKKKVGLENVTLLKIKGRK